MKKALLLLIIFILLFLVFFSFQKKELTYSFYHWKSVYNIKNTQEKVYIKVLDIDISNKIETIKTSFNQKAPKDFIPVVYITNEAMKNAFLEELVNIVAKNINKLPYEFEELQIDCDWTLSTKAKYFEFLKRVKEKTKKKLSATIRLHQIKYQNKTGVPPVDYGLLMYYNMSDIANFKTKNSILDNQIAKKYHYNFDVYPLKLKLALPLYSQAIQFRNKKGIDIFEGVKKEDFNKNFKHIKDNLYFVEKSFYFKGRYVYKGDVFRFEESSYDKLQIALKDFFKISKNSFDEVVFYTIQYKNKYNLKSLLKGE